MNTTNDCFALLTILRARAQGRIYAARRKTVGSPLLRHYLTPRPAAAARWAQDAARASLDDTWVLLGPGRILGPVTAEACGVV